MSPIPSRIARRQMKSHRKWKSVYKLLKPRCKPTILQHRSWYKCKIRHHTLLHNDQRSDPKVKQHKTFNSTNKQSPNSEENTTKKIQSHVGTENKQVLLATALILRVPTVSGTYEYLRDLIDPGSQATLVTEKATIHLSLPRKHIQADITGVEERIPNKSNSRITVKCAPRSLSDFTLTTELLVAESHNCRFSLPKRGPSWCITGLGRIPQHHIQR